LSTAAPVFAPIAPITPSSSAMREIFLWDIRREKRINKGKGDGETF